MKAAPSLSSIAGPALGYVNQLLKNKRYISRGLHAASKIKGLSGLTKLRNLAAMKGYGRRRRRRQRGSGFFDDVGRFFTKTIPSGFRSAGNWIKDNKVISRGLSLIPHPAGKAAGFITGQLGLGRRRRMRGGCGSCQSGGAKRFGAILV
jgi:hypothetical protein